MMAGAAYSHDPSSVAAARALVSEALSGYAPGLRDRAVWMVSELATNAVRHTQAGFSVNVETTSTAVRVEVRDFGRGPPVLRHPAPVDPTGRGLLIVQSLSDQWGVNEFGNGKAVWFALFVPPEAKGSSTVDGARPPPERGLRSNLRPHPSA